MWVMKALPGCHCNLRGRRASWIRGVRGDESEEEPRGCPKVESLPVLMRAALGSRDLGDVLRRVQLLNSTRSTSCPLEGAPCHNLTRRASGRKTVVGIFNRLDRSRGLPRPRPTCCMEAKVLSVVLFYLELYARQPLAVAACSTRAHRCTSVPWPIGVVGSSRASPDQKGALSSAADFVGILNGCASVVKTQSSSERRSGAENKR
mgnify:CR=1 FL=1